MTTAAAPPHPVTVEVSPDVHDVPGQTSEQAALENLATHLGAQLTGPPVEDTTPGWDNARSTATRRVGTAGYRRWLDHVSFARGCHRPIRLTGQLHTINTTTGEIHASRSTDTMPDGVVYVPCGDRRATICPACAETYRADTYHLVRAGLVGGKGIPDTVASHPAVFLTLTAPSFGPVHTRTLDKAGRVKPCRMRRRLQRCPHGKILACPQRHTENSPCLGRPICSGCYDYDTHVVWNAYASELWRRTTITAHRYLRRLERAFNIKLRLSFAKVAEYQARGVVHFHALIRLDTRDPNDPDAVIPPPSDIGTAYLTNAIHQAAATTTVHTPPHPTNPSGWPLTWGTQIDIRPVTSDGELTDTAVAGYLAKYATKATEPTGHHSRRLTTETIGQYADYQTHIGALITRCWTLGTHPTGYTHDQHNQWKGTYGRLRRWAHMLGFGGHFATKSRRYSTTRKALKTARRTWQQARRQNAPHRTAEHVDDDTTLIIGTLTYAGTGHRTSGDQLLALTAAAQAREQRQAAKEERHIA